jgi:hypothetical protein
LGASGLAFAFDAVGVAATFAGELGPVPDQEAGVAGEFVGGLGNDLDNEFLGYDLPAWCQAFIESIGFVEFGDDAAGIRGIRGLECFKGTVLGFLDVRTDFVVIGCHFR